MPESKDGFKWILTMIDYAMSWPLAIPMKLATLANVADTLLTELIQGPILGSLIPPGTILGQMASASNLMES
ncbi:hypothetical protein CROQUDRAFT_94127 [Cronartium quercuum f. sp. fusiforme G11]|uniref:Uncharacterized protein n=1 Tax=Cronartium quercuum f. sp. fusiforme G11 TaxID=708437 RepID=A0A9P6NJG0_9BASI|nr:hypothetical protein CROQUDRAFT_94127 [Cronartium quercuum f. sp. fusiforme G11]